MKEKTYKPLSKNVIVKIANDTNKTKAGIIVSNYNTELYEVVSIPEELPDGYKDLKVGSKFYAWKNWKGFSVSDRLGYFCIDLLDVAAIVE